MEFDLLDAVLDLEGEAARDAARRGRQFGADASLAEGRKLGAERGRPVGEEAGFYRGFARAWSALARRGTLPPRAARALDRFAAAAEALRVDEPRREAMLGEMDEARARFSAFVAALGVQATFSAQQAPRLEF